MIAKVAGRGTSFKGSALYYLHDKRLPGEAERLTSERVAWTETRNLMTANPEKAWRIMAADSMNLSALKEEAGTKRTKTGNAQHVYTYSLSWSVEERGKISREEMLKAVGQTLKVLKAEQQPALIVCHQDEPQPHVHVILSRVNPTTGKLWVAPLREFDRLSRWAYQYRKERGEQEKYCPDRTKKHEGQLQAQAQTKKAPAQDKAKLPALPKTKAAELYQKQADTRRRHEQEWKDLAAVRKARRERIWQDARARMQAEQLARDKEAERQQWRDFFKDERERRYQFDREARSFSRYMHRAMRDSFKKGFFTGLIVTGIFLAAASAAAHQFEQEQKARRAAFADRIKAPIDAQVARIKVDRFKQLAVGNRSFATERRELRTKQRTERVQIAVAWKELYAERARAAQLREHTSRSRKRMTLRTGQNLDHARRLERPQTVTGRQSVKTATARPNVERPTPQLETKPVRDFERARALETGQAPTRAPVQKVEVSTPAPAPAPAGMSPSHSRVVDVPQIDKAAEWAKTEEGRAAVRGNVRPTNDAREAFKAPEPPAPPKRWNEKLRDQPANQEQTAERQHVRPEWEKAATPPAPEIMPELSPRAERWNERARGEPTEPAKERTRDRERDFDLER